MSNTKSDNKKAPSKKGNASSAADPHNQQREVMTKKENNYPHENDYDVDENDFDQRKKEYKDYEDRSRK